MSESAQTILLLKRPPRGCGAAAPCTGRSADGAVSHRGVDAGDAFLEDLKAIKNASKQRLKTASDQDARLEGVAEYFFSIAAALVYHEALISSHDARELAAVFLDLAAVSPSPWDDLLGRASWSCGKRGG